MGFFGVVWVVLLVLAIMNIVSFWWLLVPPLVWAVIVIGLIWAHKNL